MEDFNYERNLNDDEILRSYLLGKLPDREVDGLEQRLLAEDELFELAEAVEADLLADASRGELTPEERRRVSHRLASSPQGRERYALAGDLNAAADEVLGSKPREAVVIPMPLPRQQRPHRAHWMMKLAASLILAAGLGWLVWPPPPPPPSQGNHISGAIRTPPPQPASTPTPPEPAPDRVVQKETPRLPAPVPPKPVKAVLQLALLGSRGGAETGTLILPKGTTVAEIQIDAEGLEDLQPFHVAVRSQERRMVWEAGGVKPRSLDWGPALVIEVPANELAAGRYEVSVTSESGPELTQEFEVVREKN